VSHQQDNLEIAQLEKVNAELSQSLSRCRELLRECRENLAANSNQEESDEGGALLRQERDRR
jgi:hypothetical protein